MKEISDPITNKKYLEDKRWKLIKYYCKRCMFGKANETLCQLRKDYGLDYR